MGGITSTPIAAITPRIVNGMDNRADIRGYLTSRRAKLTPDQVGLPTSTRRRVPGLRREEVAVLAGVSTEWYTRLEKGHIAGVSEEVLDGRTHTKNDSSYSPAGQHPPRTTRH